MCRWPSRSTVHRRASTPRRSPLGACGGACCRVAREPSAAAARSAGRGAGGRPRDRCAGRQPLPGGEGRPGRHPRPARRGPGGPGVGAGRAHARRAPGRADPGEHRPGPRRHRGRGGRPDLARGGHRQHARRGRGGRGGPGRDGRGAGCSSPRTRTTRSPASRGSPLRSGPAGEATTPRRWPPSGPGPTSAAAPWPSPPAHVPLRLRRPLRPPRRGHLLRLLHQRGGGRHPGHQLDGPRLLAPRRQRPRGAALLGLARRHVGAVGAGPRRGYVVYYTVREAASGRQCISRAVASSPTGPFLDDSWGPMVCQREPRRLDRPQPVRRRRRTGVPAVEGRGRGRAAADALVAGADGRRSGRDRARLAAAVGGPFLRARGRRGAVDGARGRDLRPRLRRRRLELPPVRDGLRDLRRAGGTVHQARRRAGPRLGDAAGRSRRRRAVPQPGRRPVGGVPRVLRAQRQLPEQPLPPRRPGAASRAVASSSTPRRDARHSGPRSRGRRVG